MNDIYWHDKRAMSAKQITSPPPTQPRRAYENTLRTKQYPQTDVRVNSHSITARNLTSPYLQYPTGSATRSHYSNAHFPYTSSLHGVYRSNPPTTITSPSSLHTNEIRQLDLRKHSQRPQLSRSISEDYYTSKYSQSNVYGDEVYDDEDDEEENSSEVFNYTFNHAGVSALVNLSASILLFPPLFQFVDYSFPNLASHVN